MVSDKCFYTYKIHVGLLHKVIIRTCVCDMYSWLDLLCTEQNLCIFIYIRGGPSSNVYFILKTEFLS